MENSTKRLRKARRQGLSTGGRRSPTVGRAVTGAPTRGADLPHEPRANERRRTLTTKSKTQRQQSASSRRTTRATA